MYHTNKYNAAFVQVFADTIVVFLNNNANKPGAQVVLTAAKPTKPNRGYKQNSSICKLYTARYSPNEVLSNRAYSKRMWANPVWYGFTST